MLRYTLKFRKDLSILYKCGRQIFFFVWLLQIYEYDNTAFNYSSLVLVIVVYFKEYAIAIDDSELFLGVLEGNIMK